MNSLKAREMDEKITKLERYKADTEPRLKDLEEKNRKHDAAVSEYNFLVLNYLVCFR